ncbi:hypothetical protein [Breznakiella homolactica]|uniref:Lipoprotein n=1 Tax=Breznakiella homolactica TaxID=2798577 RepID=A0A7T8BBT4_9SPIR|nr:hypothetical protein [Breznakiella homolactica]QQO10716.1 hypothetical protein JFL75_07325 [Breznakiella homolactica]
MKKNIILFIIFLCMLSSCSKNRIKIEELLEYDYDFTSGETLFKQFDNIGFKPSANFDDDLDMDIGFIDISISGIPRIEETQEMGGALIVLHFYNSSRPVPSEKNKNKIIKLLVGRYGEGSYVSFTEQELPIWGSPVIVPNLPIRRWELPDRYLYLNDYEGTELMKRHESYKDNKQWHDVLEAISGGFCTNDKPDSVFEIRIKMKE